MPLKNNWVTDAFLQVAVFYRDGSRIPSERLSRQKLQVVPIVEFHNGGTRRLNTQYEKMSLLHPGVWEIAIDLQAEFLSKDDIRDIRMMTLEVCCYCL